MPRHSDEIVLPLAYQPALIAVERAVSALKWRIHEKSEVHLVCRIPMGVWSNPGRVEVRLGPVSEKETKVKLDGSISGWGPIQDSQLRAQVSKLKDQMKLTGLAMRPSPHEHPPMTSAHAGVCKPDTPGDSESRRKPRSWREWYSWRLAYLRNYGQWYTRRDIFRDWSQWTWRDWTAIACLVAVVSIIVLIADPARMTDDPLDPSAGCRRTAERQMVKQIKDRLFDPGAMKQVDSNPNPRIYQEGALGAGENEYRVALSYTYPNETGGRDERVAYGFLAYINGETCEFRLVSAGG